jgi:hypothetical protein
MKLRYIGDADQKDLAVPGGVIECKRMKWIDAEKTAVDSGLDPRHLEIIYVGLAGHPDWELDAGLKRKATIAAKADTKENDQ